ncbi:MAG: site-2 protease family protein [Burkholderiaceae bacterium]
MTPAARGAGVLGMAWTIARVAGIDIRIHVTFLLLLVWYALLFATQTGTLAGTLAGVTFVVLVFGCVVLHELGHAFAARRYGVRTRDITLLPIGGVARLQRLPASPRAEIALALAGPAVNLALAAALAAAPAAADAPLLALPDGEASLAQSLLAVNLMLALFNLIPAFPMDGGRVLRAALALRMGPLRATMTAARVGQTIAVVFALVGVFVNPLLVLIAIFVWFGAALEAADAQMRAALGSVRLADVLIRDFRTLAPDDPLARAVELTLGGTQKDFPVLRDGRLVGLLTQRALLDALRARGEAAAVEAAMQRGFSRAVLHDSLDDVWRALNDGDDHLVPVLDGDRLVGLVDVDNLVELARIRAALDRRPH